MKHTKIAIIGAGAVGSTTGYALMLQNVAAEIMLVDVNDLRCKGETLDLSDTLSFSAASALTMANLQQARHADIILFAAGIPQKPGQSRQELLATNKKIVTDVLTAMHPINSEAIIIMITNPVDVMTYYAQQASGLPHKQVFGTGTYLDSQRLQYAVAQKLSVAEESVYAYVLGEHGDSQFTAWSCARIGGLEISKFTGLTEFDLDSIEHEVRKKVYDIISCKGATFYGIAACVASLCQMIVYDQKKVVPLSVFVPDFKVCLSVPVVLGEAGIEQIIPIQLTADEQEKLKASAAVLRSALN